jgi:hypothetical protein
MKFKTAISLLVVCALFVIPGAAFAASPTSDAYSGVAGVHQGGNNTPPSDGVDAATEEVAPVAEVAPVSEEEVATAGSTLPFTGLNVGILAVVGLGLIGGGTVLYRMNRRPAPRL